MGYIVYYMQLIQTVISFLSAHEFGGQCIMPTELEVVQFYFHTNHYMNNIILAMFSQFGSSSEAQRSNLLNLTQKRCFNMGLDRQNLFKTWNRFLGDTKTRYKLIKAQRLQPGTLSPPSAFSIFLNHFLHFFTWSDVFSLAWYKPLYCNPFTV